MGDDYEPYQWQIGDPADWGDGACVPDLPYMGYLNNDDDDDRDDGREPERPPQKPQKSKADVFGEEAWRLYENLEDEKALVVIDVALDIDDMHANNWNIKAIILEDMNRFEESKDCYDTSIRLRKSGVVVDNKARMIRTWTSRLFNDDILDKGIALLKEAIDEISTTDDSKENISIYPRSLETFEKRVPAARMERHLLEEYSDCTLITIAGTEHYGYPHFETKTRFTLKKEPENTHDRDAIGVYLDGKKVGYVANSEQSNAEITKPASMLRNLPEVAHAEYLFVYKCYYYIAAITTSRGKGHGGGQR